MALAKACEESPIEALFRSDHYLSVVGRTDRGSLDAWATIAGLAAMTTRAPPGDPGLPGHLQASLGAREERRHRRSHLGRRPDRAGDGHRLAGGGTRRLRLPLPAHGRGSSCSRSRSRSSAASGMRVSSTSRASTTGSRDYALPKPLSPPNLIVGGRAKPRSLRLAPRWADEYNLVMMSAEECAEAIPNGQAGLGVGGRDQTRSP